MFVNKRKARNDWPCECGKEDCRIQKGERYVYTRAKVASKMYLSHKFRLGCFLAWFSLEFEVRKTKTTRKRKTDRKTGRPALFLTQMRANEEHKLEVHKLPLTSEQRKRRALLIVQYHRWKTSEERSETVGDILQEMEGLGGIPASWVA